MSLLQCQGLVKRFGRKTAVDRMSLTLDAGKVLGIIGPNGAGKSTLIKMITGLIWPDEGNVTILGKDVHREHALAMRKTGAIIEWPAFIPYLSARRNLEILSGGHGPEYRRRMAEVTAMVEMADLLDEPVGTFSTGMKQRLGIALALLPHSQFIILDEPTNGLDPGGIVEIRAIIREFNRHYGTTIILTSHMLGEIEHICHEIAIINHGVIAAQGSLAELLHKEKIVVVHASPVDRAEELLNRACEEGRLPIEKLRRGDENALLVQVTVDCAADINRILVENGVAVTRLAMKQKHLEEFFLETTTEKSHVVQRT